MDYPLSRDRMACAYARSIADRMNRACSLLDMMTASFASRFCRVEGSNVGSTLICRRREAPTSIPMPSQNLRATAVAVAGSSPAKNCEIRDCSIPRMRDSSAAEMPRSFNRRCSSGKFLVVGAMRYFEILFSTITFPRAGAICRERHVSIIAFVEPTARAISAARNAILTSIHRITYACLRWLAKMKSMSLCGSHGKCTVRAF